MSMKLLEGERALITGCAGGIGRGIAKALLAEGATVLGADITAPPAGDGSDFLAADGAAKKLASKTGMTMVMKELARVLVPDGISSMELE